MFFNLLKSFFLTHHHAHFSTWSHCWPWALSCFVRHGKNFGQIVFQRIFNHTGWGLPPTFPDVTFNPSVMQSNSAFLAQVQGSNSRRQCAGHDHLHRSGRRHGNEAIQSEEGAQFHVSGAQTATNVNENQSTQIVPFNARSRVTRLEAAMWQLARLI